MHLYEMHHVMAHMPRVRWLPGQNLPGTIDLGKIARLMSNARVPGPYGCNREDLAGGSGEGLLPEIAFLRRSVIMRHFKRQSFGLVLDAIGTPGNSNLRAVS